MGQVEQFWFQPAQVRLVRVADAVVYSQKNLPGAKTVSKRRVDTDGRQWVFPWLFHACLVREVLIAFSTSVIIFLRMLISKTKGKMCSLFRILKIMSPSRTKGCLKSSLKKIWAPKTWSSSVVTPIHCTCSTYLGYSWGLVARATSANTKLTLPAAIRDNCHTSDSGSHVFFQDLLNCDRLIVTLQVG